MITVSCRRCNSALLVEEGSKVKYCQKGSVCYRKRCGEAVKRSLNRKRLRNTPDTPNEN